MSTRTVLVLVMVGLVVVAGGWWLSSLWMGKSVLNNQQQQISDDSDSLDTIQADIDTIPSDASVDADVNQLGKDLESF